MTTQEFTPQDIDRLGPAGVEDAIRAGQPSAPVQISTDPKTIGQVFKRVDAYGIDITSGVHAQIINEAGLVQLFTIQTGLSSFVPRNLLPAKLREVNEGGYPVWTTKQNEALPLIQPKYPCMLHKDHAFRDTADQMGFIICEKMMTTPSDVEDHSKKHSKAWAASERMKADAKEEKTEAWQQASMTAITSTAMQQGSPQPQMIEKTCTECAESVFATNPESASIKLGVHMKSHEGIFIAEEPTSMTIHPPFHVTDTTEKMIPRPSPTTTILDDFSGATTISFTGPVPSPEQELLLAKVKKSPGWCPEDECDFVCDSKSIAGAKISLSHHTKKEHPDG